VKNVFLVRKNLIIDIYHLLNNIHKKCDEFDNNKLTEKCCSAEIKIFLSRLRSLKIYNTFEKFQEMLIKFEKCDNCYEQCCDRTLLCTDMIHLMNKIANQIDIKEFKSIYRLIYQLREINYRVIDLDNNMFNGNLEELDGYKDYTINVNKSDRTISSSDLIDYTIIEKIENK
jgi:hypothetical protein